MGTSQSHKLKTGPNWAEAKRSITSVANERGDNDENCKKFAYSFSNALGDDVYRNNRRRSGRSLFGNAGARMSNNLVSFIEDVRSNGLAGVLQIGGLPADQQPAEKKDFIEKILSYLSGEHDSSMDDVAAIYAMDKLLDDILADCETQEEIEQKIKNATEEDLVKWIVSFEIEYILEYSAELFQSHIFSKCDNPERVLSQIRNWLQRELDEKLTDNLKEVNLDSQEGKNILDNLTAEILEIWKQE